MTKRNPLYLMLAMAVLLSSISCLSSCKHHDDDEDDVFTYSTSAQTTLVTAFGLQANNDVLANLDSVHFTVDYDNGLIYNADSLPVGTDITALKVTVEFLNTVKSAVFTITGATAHADTTISYTASMSKSLDFSGKTTLTVTSADDSRVKDYEVKVLVHKVNPDSLVWPQSWRRDLQGIESGAIAYKTVKQGELYRSMAYDGTTCTVLTTLAPDEPYLDKNTVQLPFEPVVSSLTACGDDLYMLDGSGVLYASHDGVAWSSCGVVWHSVLGSYEGRVLGIAADGNGGYYHDEYPRGEGFAVTAVEDGFPVEGSTDMVVIDNTWSDAPQGMIVGGVDAQGNLLRSVWGYDGIRWGQINNERRSALPAVADATIFPYYTYKALSGVRRYGKQPTWLLMGGRLSDGTLNRKIYLSTTQGITWVASDSTLTQASHMPDFYGAQAFVVDETINGANRAPSMVSKPVTEWSCPFIYLMGGYNAQGSLLPNVWRGVYIRMTNYPVY